MRLDTKPSRTIAEYEAIVLDIAERARKYAIVNGGPAGLCFDSSCFIVEEFDKIEDNGEYFGSQIMHGSVNSQPHSWVELSLPGEYEIRLLDVTLDQFGDYPEIVWSTPEEWPIYKYDEEDYES